MDISLLFLLIAVLIVGVLVFVAILVTQNRSHAFNKEAYQTDFLIIENSLTKTDLSSHNMAIVEADKLLDKALIELNLPGKTMGERLKKSGSRFSQLNAVWRAHKLRNQIAHEPGFSVDYNQSKHALATYRQALKDLGAI